MSLLPEENGNIVTHPGSESEILKLLSDSYLYKDILDWEHIKKADKIVKLLQALALIINYSGEYRRFFIVKQQYEPLFHRL